MVQNESQWREEIGPFVRTQQIIVLALTGGLLSFSAVAFFIASQQEEQAQTDFPVITLAALVFAVAAVFARMVVVPAITRANRNRIAAGQPNPDRSRQPQGQTEPQERWGDAGQLLALHQVRTIISAAILEGSGFFCFVAYLVEGSSWTLAMGLAVTAAVAAHLPTQNGVIHWIEDELKRVEDLRKL